MITIRTTACIFTLLLAALFVPVTASYADAEQSAVQSNAAPYGLAMHGHAKYDQTDTHLSYVNPDAPKGGTRTEGTSGTFDTLNPYSIKGIAAQGLNLYYDRLMQRVWDEPFTMYPLIAEKAVVADDRSAITFFINPAARFHDSSPITLDDIKFSFETLRESGRPNMQRLYKLVDDVTLDRDAGSIRFDLGDGYDQETVLILSMMPVLSKAWWKDRDFAATTLTPPLSSGPYIITDVDPGRRIVYERDPDYWAANLMVNVGHYNFDRVIYDYFRDDTAAFESFKAGDLTFRREWNAGKWASGYDFPAAQNGDVITAEIGHQRPERIQSLIFNTRRTPFDDIRVRKALSRLIDFEWINDNLFHGKYKRIESFFANSPLAAPDTPSAEEIALLSPWKDSLPAAIFETRWRAPTATNNKEWRQELRTADSLLKEAGWIVQDGKRVNKDTGAPFEFEIMISSPAEKKIVLSFAKNLSRLGIQANVRLLDDANFQNRLSRYDYDMTLYYWRNSLSPGTEQTLYWSCESADIPYRWNYPGICHPAVDALSRKIADAKTRGELVTAVHALDRILTWQHYVIPLFYAGYDMVAYDKAIKRPDVTPLYGMVIESWWIEE